LRLQLQLLAHPVFSDVPLEQLQASVENNWRDAQTYCVDNEGPQDFRCISFRYVAERRTHVSAGVEEGASGGNIADGLLSETGESVGKRVSIWHLLYLDSLLTFLLDLLWPLLQTFGQVVSRG